MPGRTEMRKVRFSRRVGRYEVSLGFADNERAVVVTDTEDDETLFIRFDSAQEVGEAVLAAVSAVIE
jgi:hypothetical protein